MNFFSVLTLLDHCEESGHRRGIEKNLQGGAAVLEEAGEGGREGETVEGGGREGEGGRKGELQQETGGGGNRAS